jgi:hypothetical protein
LRFFLFRGLSRASAYADAWHWSYSIQDARWALCCSIYLVVKWESWVSPWSVCDHLGCRLRLAGGAEYSRWITGKEHFAFVHFDTKGQRYRWSFVCSWKKPWRSGNTLVNLFLNFLILISTIKSLVILVLRPNSQTLKDLYSTPNQLPLPDLLFQTCHPVGPRVDLESCLNSGSR